LTNSIALPDGEAGTTWRPVKCYPSPEHNVLPITWTVHITSQTQRRV
jgi:hypothetical protein